MSTTESTQAPVHASVVVAAPIERAFEVFSTGIGSWWPDDRHILKAPLAEMVFEPRVGGHIYDRGVDSSESHWARVLAYEPPHRLVFSWDISLQWELEPDPERTSEVEVRFIADGDDRTRVELEHRHLERHGAGWEQMREAVNSPGGWSGGLRAFAQRLRA